MIDLKATAVQTATTFKTATVCQIAATFPSPPQLAYSSRQRCCCPKTQHQRHVATPIRFKQILYDIIRLIHADASVWVNHIWKQSFTPPLHRFWAESGAFFRTWVDLNREG